MNPMTATKTATIETTNKGRCKVTIHNGDKFVSATIHDIYPQAARYAKLKNAKVTGAPMCGQCHEDMFAQSETGVLCHYSTFSQRCDKA